MATTPNFGIPLIDAGVRDPVQKINQILNAIDALLLENQIPGVTSLKWGDILAGRYLEARGAGVTVHGSLDVAQNQILGLVVERGNAFPGAPVAGQLFYRDDLSTLYVYTGAWTAAGAVNAGSVDAAGAVMVTDYGAVEGTVLAIVGGVPAAVLPVGPASILIWDGVSTSFKTLDDALYSSYTEGSLTIGAAAPGTATTLAAGALDRVLAVGAGAGKLEWRTPLSAFGKATGAKGDIAIGTGAGTAAMHAVPADGSILIADSAEPDGWNSKAVGLNIGDLIELEDDGLGNPALPPVSGYQLQSIPFPPHDVMLTAHVDVSRTATLGLVSGLILPRDYPADTTTVNMRYPLCMWRVQDHYGTRSSELRGWDVQLLDGGSTAPVHQYSFAVAKATNADVLAGNPWTYIGVLQSGAPTGDGRPLYLGQSMSSVIANGDYVGVFCLSAPRYTDGNTPGGGASVRLFLTMAAA